MKPSNLSGWVAVLALACAACATAPDPVSAADPPVVTARMRTQAIVGHEPNAAVVLSDGAEVRIIGTAELGGLEHYGLDGRRTAATPAGDVSGIASSTGFALAGKAVTVLVALDGTGNTLRFLTPDGPALREIGARAVPLGFAAEGVCLYSHPLDGALYAFVVGDGGEIEQQMIYANADGKLDSRQVRRLHLPSSLTQCVVDSAASTLYVAEETVGVWRFSADPETDVSARLVDAPGLGHLEEEVKGVALFGAGWLLASDASAGRINVYDRTHDDAYVGSFAVQAAGAGEPVEEPGPLLATRLGEGTGFEQGLLLVTDEDALDYKALALADVATAIERPLPAAAAVAKTAVPVVAATVETVPVPSFGDAADDPAIWAHPTDPAQSLVVATNKKGGLYLYDMRGQVVHYLPDGKLNNVDFREGFDLGGKPTIVVTASDRTRKAVAIYRLDPVARRLENVADGVIDTGLDDPYGLCMFRSGKDGATYVFITSGDGAMRQWKLRDAGNGRVGVELVRELSFDTQPEGCAVDDATGVLYVAEEDVALWRLGAEPDAGSGKRALDRVDGNPAIKDDLEGVSIYDLGDGRGYLVVSSQGNNTYAVYRREGDQAYIGSFAVVADGALGIDGVSETDGLDVSSRNLGPGFEHGAMVAQDGRNVLPTENQNYKYVPWSAIARALKLESKATEAH